MNETFKILRRLPKHITGRRLELDSASCTPWEKFRTMRPQTRTFYMRSILSMYLPDAPTFEAVRAAIRIKENYDHLCQKIRDFEARTDVRNYWMYSIAKQRIVGTLDAAGTPFKKKDQKALTIGYAVIRAQRGNGYARRAARLFTRSAAAMGIAYDFYADVIRSDYQRGPTKREKASAACLIKAGFREIPEGGSTPNGDADDVERQFALEFPTRGATATRPLRHARKIRAKQHTR